MSVHVATCQVAILHDDGGGHFCPEPQVAVCDVPMQSDETTELALCAEHLRLLHDALDPIEQARKWLT